MLTPADIERKQFAATRLKEGYAQDEVDAFLDQVAAEYRSMQRDIESLTVQLRAERSKPVDPPTVVLDTASPSFDSIKKLMVTAEQTAAQIQAEATAEATRLKNEAATHADGLRADARTEAAQIVGAAHNERQLKIAELRKQHDELATAVKALDERHAGMREWLKSSLDAFGVELSKGAPDA